MLPSSDAKEQIRDATDIVALVGEKVALRRAGRTWKGLCPFHAERTPSFTVSPDRQMWHCFGCGKGGDVFAWVTEMEKVPFPEALRILSERAGIELPQQARGPGDAARDRLYQANNLANDYFRASLASDAGGEARAYLAGRGFEGPILETFQVGWAPPGWDGLVTTLGKLLPLPVLEEAGLALRRGDGTRYDRFRNRILFPVLGAAGRVAGFGGRAIAPEDQPKYLNSPETAVYRKGQLLFALPQARAMIRERKQALVVEGYLDAMRLHAAGFANAVATSGTALTYDQARILARSEPEAVLVYDGDDAGVRAADRALEPLMRAGLPVRVLLLPAGDDPDSFVRKEGAAAFGDLLAKTLDAADFLARAHVGTGGTGGAGGQNPTVEARVRRYVEVIGRVDDPIRRRLLVRRGAEAFGLEEQVFLEALGKRGSGSRAVGATTARRIAEGPPEAQTGVITTTRTADDSSASESDGGGFSSPPDRAESDLAARLLTEDGALAEVAEHGGEACFRHEGLRELVRPWLLEGRIPLYGELRDLMSENPLARAVLADHPISEDSETTEASRQRALELIRRLEERRINALIDVLRADLRQAELACDTEKQRQIAVVINDWKLKLPSRMPSAVN